MKGVQAKFPYDDYWLYIEYSNKDKRNYAILVNRNNSKIRTTVSYAKYLMCIELKRFLNDNETVDHINEIKDDDRIENLQILTHKENSIKYAKLRVKKKMARCKCPNCGKIFVIQFKQTHIAKHGVFTSCSRHCCGVLRRKLQMKIIVDLSDNILDEFFVDATT